MAEATTNQLEKMKDNHKKKRIKTEVCYCDGKIFLSFLFLIPFICHPMYVKMGGL